MSLTREQLLAQIPEHFRLRQIVDGRVWVRGGSALSAAWAGEKKGNIPATPAVGPGFGAGTELKRIMTEKGVPACAACHDLANRMDLWGKAECRNRLEEIVEEIMPRAKEWWRRKRHFISRFLPGVVEEAGIRLAVRRHVLDAIDHAPESMPDKPIPAVSRPVARRTAPPHPRSRRPYRGWRSAADGPEIDRGPFESKIRHLTYFVWPSRKTDSWRWNLQQLAKRFSVFNGERLIGIAHDKESETPETVLAFASDLGMQFEEVIIKPNNPKLREVVTWLPMLEHLIPGAAPNEVVFSAHAKGQKYDDGQFTRQWTEIMYSACLDYWQVTEQILKTKLMAGCFREYGLLGKWHNWAYSGTFYWWRPAEIRHRRWRQVDQWFAGTESWPGLVCEPREVGVIFGNDTRRLYEQDYFQGEIIPAWQQWRAKRAPGMP